MSNIEIWLLAIGLAMDCLAVSIASGIILKKADWRTMLTMSFFFGFFQAAMPFIGWLGANYFSQFIQDVDHWVAFALLLFLGGKMIIESFKDEDCKKDFDPSSLKVILALSIATSIDALAVGISFAFLGMNTVSSILSPILIIGFVSFMLSLCGLLFGIFCGNRRNLRVELWGGIILVAIGTKILIEHLFFME
ncbi:MAG: manganese efflux pump MntP family protein [Bacteroidaceae bacterium]